MLVANSNGLPVKSILAPESPERGPLIYIKSDIILLLKMDKLTNVCTPSLPFSLDDMPIYMPIRYFLAYQVSREV